MDQRLIPLKSLLTVEELRAHRQLLLAGLLALVFTTFSLFGAIFFMVIGAGTAVSFGYLALPLLAAFLTYRLSERKNLLEEILLRDVNSRLADELFMRYSVLPATVTPILGRPARFFDSNNEELEGILYIDDSGVSFARMNTETRKR